MNYDPAKKLSIFKLNKQFSALPTNSNIATYYSYIHDARIDTLEDFFKKYKSPLQTHAQAIVENADKYELDYRLLPAIAMKESTLCKKIPDNSYNCWGFGIYGGKITRFSSFEEAIETVSEKIAKDYVKKGLTDPETMMAKYNPVSQGTWADTVNLIMDRIHSSI